MLPFKRGNQTFHASLHGALRGWGSVPALTAGLSSRLLYELTRSAYSKSPREELLPKRLRLRRSRYHSRAIISVGCDTLSSALIHLAKQGTVT